MSKELRHDYMTCRRYRALLTVVPRLALCQNCIATLSTKAKPSNALEIVESTATHTCGWTLIPATCHSSMGVRLLAATTAAEHAVTIGKLRQREPLLTHKLRVGLNN